MIPIEYIFKSPPRRSDRRVVGSVEQDPGGKDTRGKEKK
jgi:hypothetical protein